MSTNKTDLQPGPYTKSFSKTIKVAPIEITITEKHESSHVPPPDCGCGKGGLSIDELLGMASSFANAAASATVPPTAAEPDDGHAH